MSSSDTPSPFSGDLPVASDDILMLSLPDTQDAGKATAVADVFHTPPEESSLPSSDVDVCTVNHAVDVDAGTQGFVDFCDAPESVDLGKDSQLGFSEVQAECSCGVGGDDSGENSKRHIHEFEKENSDLGEYLVKKSKHYDCDSGYVSSGDCTGVQSEKVKEGVDKGKEKLVSENDGVVNSDKVACVVEVNKCTGVEEGPEMQRKNEGGTRVLPPSVSGRVENVASEGNGGRKMSVFDVLRALSTMRDDEEDDDNPNLMDDARAIGINFPRPRWYPKNFKP